MDILLYLTALLETRKTIGIAGLGTLYKKKSPGKYDVEKHAFVPPSFTLSFSPTVEEQDVLVNYISQERNLSADSAAYYIHEFVEGIHTQLAETHEADLGSLGKLQLVNDELVLVNPEAQNLGFEFFGLPTVNELAPVTAEGPNADTAIAEENNQLEEIVEENSLEEQNPGQETTEPNLAVDIENQETESNSLIEDDKIQDDQPVFDEIAEVEIPPVQETPTVENQETEETPAESPESPIEEEKTTSLPIDTFTPVSPYTYLSEENDDDDEDDDDDDGRPNKFLRILLRILIVLFVIIIAGVLAYFFFPGWFDKKIINNYTEQAGSTSAYHVPDSTAQDSILNDSLAKVSVAHLVKDTSALDSSKVTTYEVIGSAEKSQKRIDHVVNLMKKKGIIAKPLQHVPGKLVKISLGSFTDYNLAKKFQDSLRILLKNPQIYIQSIKPKN